MEGGHMILEQSPQVLDLAIVLGAGENALLLCNPPLGPTLCSYVLLRASEAIS